MSKATAESVIRLDVVDFHNHHVPARFDLTAARFAPANQRARQAGSVFAPSSRLS
jgi:hypothetical protein